MFRRRTQKTQDRPLPPGFVENYPFTVLIDNGWSVQRTSDAHTRRRRVGPVHTVVFVHPDRHTAIFDINRLGRMSDHATYTLARPGDDDAMFFAYTADAVADLATAPPTQSAAELAAIPGVRRLR